MGRQIGNAEWGKLGRRLVAVRLERGKQESVGDHMGKGEAGRGIGEGAAGRSTQANVWERVMGREQCTI